MRSLLLALLLGLITLAIAPCVRAQVGLHGPVATAMGEAGVARPGQTWSNLNPGGWAAVASGRFSLYATQAFGLSELRLLHGTAVVPVRGLAIGGSAWTFGDDRYRESDMSVTVARAFFGDGSLLDVGVRLGMRMITIDGYGTHALARLDVGWIAEAMPGVFLGGAIENVTDARWSDVDGVPRMMRLGASLARGPGSTFSIDVIKEERQPWSVAMGVEVRLVEAFTLRSGAATSPDRIGVGAEIRIGTIAVDLLVDRYDTLGWSPGIALEVGW